MFLITQREIKADANKISIILDISPLLVIRKSKYLTNATLTSTGSSAGLSINASPSSRPLRRIELTFVGVSNVKQCSEVWRLIWHPATPIQTFFWQNVISLSQSLWHSYECSFVSGEWRCAKFGLLRQQVLDWCPNEIHKNWKANFYLFITTRKLRRYFQSFHIIMLPEYPLRAIMQNFEAFKRIEKWATKIILLRVTF